MDQGFSTDVIYFNFSKAFDSVPHNRLLGKLKGYSADGQLFEWFRCFLVGRHQRVHVNGFLFSWAQVDSGVPQGSVLGPLLFTLYVNELPSLVSNSLLMFADDIKLYWTIRGPEDFYNYKKILIFYSNGLISGYCHLMLLNIIMLLTVSIITPSMELTWNYWETYEIWESKWILN